MSLQNSSMMHSHRVVFLGLLIVANLQKAFLPSFLPLDRVDTYHFYFQLGVLILPVWLLKLRIFAPLCVVHPSSGTSQYASIKGAFSYTRSRSLQRSISELQDTLHCHCHNSFGQTPHEKVTVLPETHMDLALLTFRKGYPNPFLHCQGISLVGTA